MLNIQQQGTAAVTELLQTRL